MKEFKSFYKEVAGNEGTKCHYPTRLDTYGCGCQHDCNYCYAKSLLDFRNLWNPNDPAVADINKIIKKIRTMKVPVIRLGGMTDCFQPIEQQYGVTYETIKALNKARQEYLIVTKSDLVASDKYIEILDKDLAHIQITVTCFDDEQYKSLAYEKAPLPSRRIQAIEKLYDAGYDVQLRLSPFIPEYVNYERLAAIRCDKLIVEFLRVNTWIMKWFDIDYSPYTVKHGGYRHLPLDKKIGLLQNIHGFKEISVCEDEDEAYDYWQKHNPNPDDCCNLRRNRDNIKEVVYPKKEEPAMDKMEIVYMKLSDLKPYEKNPRYNKNAVMAVAKSIDDYGFKNPIILDKDNVIVCGHTRYEAAKRLGLKEVPVIIAKDLTEKQIKALRIADNKTSDFSIWDNKLLLEELADLDDMFTGFTFEELENLSLLDESDKSLINDNDFGTTYEVLFRSEDQDKIKKIQAMWENLNNGEHKDEPKQ